MVFARNLAAGRRSLASAGRSVPQGPRNFTGYGQGQTGMQQRQQAAPQRGVQMQRPTGNTVTFGSQQQQAPRAVAGPGGPRQGIRQTAMGQPMRRPMQPMQPRPGMQAAAMQQQGRTGPRMQGQAQSMQAHFNAPSPRQVFDGLAGRAPAPGVESPAE